MTQEITVGARVHAIGKRRSLGMGEVVAIRENALTIERWNGDIVHLKVDEVEVVLPVGTEIIDKFGRRASIIEIKRSNIPPAPPVQYRIEFHHDQWRTVIWPSDIREVLS